MRLDLNRSGTEIRIRLSERTLLALLAKLHEVDSQRTLTCGDCYRDGQPAGDLTVLLSAEPDDLHYARRADPPGRLHARTETFIRIHTAVVGSASALPARTKQPGPPISLEGWVFAQDQVWVDQGGVEVEIETMPLDQVDALLAFLRRQAARICAVVAEDGADEEAVAIQTAIAEQLSQQAESILTCDDLGREAGGWLEQRPLIHALERRGAMLR